MIRLTLIAAALIAAHAGAQDLPRMKAGLWESTLTTSGAKGAAAHSTKSTLCLNETTQTEMMAFGRNMGAKCSKNVMRRDGNKYIADVECNFGPSLMKSQSVTTFSGDSSYRGETRTTFSPPMGGISESTTLQEGKYAGPCPANMKPGDMNMGGRVTNIHDAAKAMKGMAK